MLAQARLRLKRFGTRARVRRRSFEAPLPTPERLRTHSRNRFHPLDPTKSLNRRHNWHYRDASGEWQRIGALRNEYRRKVGKAKLALVYDAKLEKA